LSPLRRRVEAKTIEVRSENLLKYPIICKRWKWRVPYTPKLGVNKLSGISLFEMLALFYLEGTRWVSRFKKKLN
jgi:hypothetical protein